MSSYKSSPSLDSQGERNRGRTWRRTLQKKLKENCFYFERAGQTGSGPKPLALSCEGFILSVTGHQPSSARKTERTDTQGYWVRCWFAFLD